MTNAEPSVLIGLSRCSEHVQISGAGGAALAGLLTRWDSPNCSRMAAISRSSALYFHPQLRFIGRPNESGLKKETFPFKGTGELIVSSFLWISCRRQWQDSVLADTARHSRPPDNMDLPFAPPDVILSCNFMHSMAPGKSGEVPVISQSIHNSEYVYCFLFAVESYFFFLQLKTFKSLIVHQRNILPGSPSPFP